MFIGGITISRPSLQGVEQQAKMGQEMPILRHNGAHKNLARAAELQEFGLTEISHFYRDQVSRSEIRNVRLIRAAIFLEVFGI